MSSLRIAVALVLLNLVSPMLMGHAQETGDLSEEDQRARSLFDLGDDLYSQGRYEEALAAFQEAYDLSGRPLLLFNIANAQERSGHWDGAIESLRSYLPHADESERVRVETRIASLESRVARMRDAQGPDPEPEEPSNIAGPLVLGAGGALLAGGVVMAILAKGARDDLDDACVGVDGRRLCPSDVRDSVDRDRGMSLGADILFVAAAAAVGVGLYLLLRNDDDDEPAIEAGAIVTPNSGGVVLRATF